MDHTEEPLYRQYVGMRGGYDLMGGLQFALLLSLGLREQHKLCDVGCGSLRAGRLFVPYLATGNYYGIEPQRWLVEEGLRREVGGDLAALRQPHFDHGDDFGLARFDASFDFVLAQSIFSHTYRDLALDGVRNISAALAHDGLFVGTFYERFPVVLPQGRQDRPDVGSGWVYPGCVAFTWREWTALLREAGLTVRRIRWFHLRQTWFVAAPLGEEARVTRAVRGVMPRLRGPGFVGHATQRAWRRLRPT